MKITTAFAVTAGLVCAAAHAEGDHTPADKPWMHEQGIRSEQLHQDAQRGGYHWYRGFIGDGVNQCRDVGGNWPPKEDLLRNSWRRAGFLAAARVEGGKQIAEVYSDGTYTTLVYGTSMSACQDMLEQMIAAFANRP
jgi:hypothetical protein